jgi:hypothetical protein
MALAFAAFLGSLSLVIWRQSRALDLLRDVDGTRTERASIESQKSRLTGRIQQMESRTRILAVAGEWWGLRVPSTDEEFVIMLRPGGDEGGGALVRPRMARAGGFGLADLALGTERD